MKRWTMAALATLLSTQVLGAPKPCEELKQEIEVKIQAANVTSYTLEVVPAGEVEDTNMVVGSCEGGSKKIIYQKND
ncbi:DUF1161 domain-containing protein [Pseudomonas sp. Gutcm_11s]|uniref:DUF1161 domain-containing protein n=1 Tax=Pseudomonas sp. Gutcm_11s TaxID=3026088 RepID=UPI002362425F|nr:DUF1161 domain-containing protein [Pseudomonas sp. Gutcm_11s]MDD0844896.1 DUF1161 domain-containing protein [Pseudomonas sp. Gutcm_11s]